MKAKDLKNSILQMAIEGKLVPQDPNDEPASVLLERIREEKHKLIAEGKAKFPKGGESIIYIGSDGSPYEKRVNAKGRVTEPISVSRMRCRLRSCPRGGGWSRAFILFHQDGLRKHTCGRPKGLPRRRPKVLIRSQNVHNERAQA